MLQYWFFSSPSCWIHIVEVISPVVNPDGNHFLLQSPWKWHTAMNSLKGGCTQKWQFHRNIFGHSGTKLNKLNFQKLFYLWEGWFCLFDLQTVASQFLATPSLQDRLKETSLCDGNTLIGQSILPTNESVPITLLCLFQSVPLPKVVGKYRDYILHTGSIGNLVGSGLRVYYH